MTDITRKPAAVKGLAVVFREYGEPRQVLQIEERDYPAPKPWQVRIKILLRPVHPSDLMTVRGVYGQRPPLPATPGYEGMGVIEEVGGFWKLLRKMLVGRRVIIGATAQGNGTWQDYLLGIPFLTALPLSPNVPNEQAAMLFVNPGAALVMTRYVLKPHRGEWLLQSAAASALGQSVIRLGKLYGFRTINLVSCQEQVAQLKALGADEVIVTENEDILKRVLEITQNKGVPYALDAVGGPTASVMTEALAERGRLLIYGQLGQANTLEVEVRNLLFMQRRLEGFWLADWVLHHPWQLLQVFFQLQKLLANGTLESPVGNSYNLQEITAAVENSEKRGRSGKTLLTSFPKPQE